ncbi:MAG: alanine--tRNA ligase [Chloroflexota bacterium]|nr:alanine--tRNA ligase [Chloroflexota bacterium]
MTSDELRAAFLSFFSEKGHKVIPSSSLVPYGDPTLLLTTAGMVQVKPYFLGEAVPPGRRLASCQKCFRTTDVELVGDSTHLTFFEMLGNFSVGDYFKEEAIYWAWEFVTRDLGLSPERLWVTIFLDDDESFRIWRQVGIPEKRIVRFGEEDNFWGPAGDSGPCGPCSEIHYDFGAEFGCGKVSCGPNCVCGRFSEIWNLVFAQYDQDRGGHRTLLPKPNIDTGMGLERTAAVVQGKSSVYETDLFIPLLERISGLAGIKYGLDAGTDKAMRIIAEHSRGIAFLVADGVIPGNEGRGYVLRRLLRRASLFGRRLGRDKPFLAVTARATIEQLGHIYPEIVQRQDFIIQVIELEVAKFGETLSTGLELLDGIVGKAASKGKSIISGKEVFRLYDTYGFPVELTQEVAAERGLSVDLSGFEREMGKQRERAKASHKFGLAEKEVTTAYGQLNIEATPFVGYHRLELKSKIIGLLADGESVSAVSEGQEASLVLEATPFYGEMGGQVGDTGGIYSPSGHFVVTDTVRAMPDIIVHQGHVTGGSLAVGDAVNAGVDKERRLDIARNHTATHLLQFALRGVLGGHVRQHGSLVTSERLRFDFSHLTAMTGEEIDRVSHIVNEKIRSNLAVYDEEAPYKKAIAEGAIALFEEKYGDTVRVVRIGEPPLSAELCGGTHVASTGEIGLFQIAGESGIGSGLRRIEAVTGRGAEKFVDRRLSLLQAIAGSLGTSLENVGDKVSSTASELDMERKRAQGLESELARIRAEALLTRAEVIGGVTVLVSRVPSSPMEVLREMGDLLREKLGSAVIVLGTVSEGRPVFLAAVTPDLVAKGYHAGEIVKQVARVAGGGGGGKATLAQAGGKDKDKLDEALRLVRGLI